MNHTSVLVNQNHEFIISRRFGKRTAIISPFTVKKSDSEISLSSDFEVPQSVTRRALRFASELGDKASFTKSTDSTFVDVLSHLDFSKMNNISAVNNNDRGIIQLIYEQIDIDNEEIKCPLLMKLNPNPTERKIKIKTNIKFTVNQLKVFPIVGTNGFIISILKPTEHVIHFTWNPENNQILSTNKTEVCNLAKNVLQPWPIFTATVNCDSMTVSLDNIFEENIDNNKKVKLITIKREIKENNEHVINCYELAENI